MIRNWITPYFNTFTHTHSAHTIGLIVYRLFSNSCAMCTDYKSLIVYNSTRLYNLLNASILFIQKTNKNTWWENACKTKRIQCKLLVAHSLYITRLLAFRNVVCMRVVTNRKILWTESLRRKIFCSEIAWI